MPSPDSTPAQEKSRVLEVQNKMGVHARPAAMIVRVANKYASVEVWVDKDNEQINGKSIMGLMMLAAGKGSRLRFIANGPAEEADRLLQEMEELFAKRFDEEH